MNYTSTKHRPFLLGHNLGLNPLLSGRGDVRQIRLPNQQLSEDKLTTLQIATYSVRALSDENHLAELEREIENKKWDIIGINE